MKGMRKRSFTEQTKRQERPEISAGPASRTQDTGRRQDMEENLVETGNSDGEEAFPSEVMEEELSELLASLPDDVMLTLLTDFGLTEEGVMDG